jgi:hypothetical protein
MTRGLAGALAAILVGLPLLTEPSWSTLAASVGAVAILAGAILARSLPLLAVGILVTLAGYTLALGMTASAPDALTATALGVTIALLVQVVDFARRVHGVMVSRDVVRAQIRYWLLSAILAAAGTAIIGALGIGLAAALPPLAAPALAVAGALAVIVSSACVVRQT